MLFNSWNFIIFFFVVLVAFFSLAHKWRIYLLFFTSYYFYMSWRWEFGFLMLGVSILNFYVGNKIATGKNKNWWMFFTSLLSLIPLLYYKYGNFFLNTIEDTSQLLGTNVSFIELKVILPVGISFFTFQALSYSIDIYRNQITPEPSLIKFVTFVSFFPQLVAGPIERTTNILPQFDEVKKFDFLEFYAGVRIFIWGLFKKVVIADRLALYVDPVFNNTQLYSGPTFFVATIFFTFQIYCDFSGYSDMAVGIGRAFGFKFMQNFNLPYLAKSTGDFWKRWHISLSTWFGDYLYKPLGGNKVKISRWIFNISIVFLVSGFWHGANWTFILWGALHACYYLVEYLGNLVIKYLKMEEFKNSSIYTLIKIPVTFSMVSFAWIFFRANSVSDAFYIINSIFSFSGNLWWGSSAFSTVIGLMMLFLLVIVQIFQYNNKLALYYREANLPKWVVAFGFIILLLGISLLGVSSNSFIYFQF